MDGGYYVEWGMLSNVIWHRVIKAHKLGLQKINSYIQIHEKLQKWDCEHIQKCIKIFKWSHYKNGGEMQKNFHHELNYNGITLCSKVLSLKEDESSKMHMFLQ
jgi:hypothetical protein